MARGPSSAPGPRVIRFVRPDASRGYPRDHAPPAHRLDPRPRAGRRVHARPRPPLPRRRRQRRSAPRTSSGSRRSVIPPAWRDVWISPYPNAPPAGGRHRRGRPAAVPLPPGLAGQARRGEVRPRHRDGHRAARRCARAAPAPTSTPSGLTRDTRAAPRRSAWSTSAASASAPTCYTERERQLRADHARAPARAHATATSCVFGFIGKSGRRARDRLTDPRALPGRRRLMRRRRDRPTRAARVQGRPPLGAAARRPTSTTTSASCSALEVTAKDFRTWHATVHARRRAGRERRAAATPRRRASGGAAGDRRRLRAARQHPDGVPVVLRRPAGDRPLRVGRDDRPGAREAPTRTPHVTRSTGRSSSC